MNLRFLGVRSFSSDKKAPIRKGALAPEDAPFVFFRSLAAEVFLVQSRNLGFVAAGFSPPCSQPRRGERT